MVSIRRFVLGVCLFLSATSLADALKDPVRLIFKSPPVRTANMTKMTFGLSQSQVDGILSLTQGLVNFGDVYYLDQERQEAGILSQTRGYSSTIYPNVLPPFLQETADPELDGEWWLRQLNATPAWDLATGRGVTIADCDSGFYYNEPDLAANMWIDHRYDLSDPKDPLMVDDGYWAYHGTAVSAIMAGVKNGSGTNGIAFGARIVPLQNFNYDPVKDTLDKEEATARCILRALTIPEVQVIVLENQTATGSSETFVGTRDAVRLALKAGVTVVSAGGNASVELKEEAGDDTGSIIVGALRSNDLPASFSNFGERVTVGAYGEKLKTLHGPDGKFGSFGGTSGATPQVAAAVALMKEVSPSLTPEKIRELLIATRVVDERNRKVGGRLDVLGAVKAAVGLTEWTEWESRQAFRRQLTALLTQ